MVETKASFILHFDGRFKQEGSYDYVGGSMKFVKTNRQIKFLELESLIHSKIGTRANDVSLSIRCRYVADPLHVILYEIKDDDDLQSMMGIFDNNGYNSLCLYITKHLTDETVYRPTLPSSTSISPSVTSQDRQHGNDPLENVSVDIPRDFEDDIFINQVHDQVDYTCTSAKDGNLDAIIDEPHVNVVDQLDFTRTTSLLNISIPIEDDQRAVTHSKDDKVGDVEYKLKVGATFPSIECFKRVVQEYAIRRKFLLFTNDSRSSKYAVRCKERTCPWRITGTKRLDVVKVKTFVSEHMCSSKLHNNDHPFVTSPWVAETCKGLFSRPEDIKVSAIVDYIKMKWDITISYRKAHTAKEIIHEIICGNADDSYRILPAYSFELTRSNPGSYMSIVQSRDIYPDGDDSFARLFWTFGPCIRALNHTLRPLVLMDSTHLRGKYRGILLIACGIDGNNGLFPLAFAIVEIEIYDSWSWFLNLFRTRFMSTGSNTITICSDREKGLPKAVSEVFANSHHRFCIRHLSASFYDKFGNIVLRDLFLKAAETLKESEFKWAMESIKENNESAHQWISEMPKENWATLYFKGDRYGALSTTKSVSFNAIVKEAKTLPITSLVEHICGKTSNIFQHRRKVGQTWTKRLTSYGEKHVQLAHEIGSKCTVNPLGVHVFEVQSVGYLNVVDLEARTCSCGVFQMIGLPCAHAMAAIGNKMLDPYDFCQPYFLAERYRDTYEEKIHQTLDRTQWQPSPDPLPLVLPPHARRMPGRPQTRKEKKLAVGAQNKCGLCGDFGHSRRTCKNSPKRSQTVNMDPIGPSTPKNPSSTSPYDLRKRSLHSPPSPKNKKVKKTKKKD
ncbi:uncharacterized protein LOC143861489 [Tasmannia lanceolata]|uniref:uncharacterized protein LOC143861489 n=1 Tax=Tasmannia lanceolata TaxID=3420 RepID=UPI00406304B0